jgi:hypothetical protein
MKIYNKYKCINKPTNNTAFTFGKYYILNKIMKNSNLHNLYWFEGDDGKNYFIQEKNFYKIFQNIKEERTLKLKNLYF